MKQPLLVFSVLMLAALVASDASARGIGKSGRGYQYIQKGVVDVGADGFFLLRNTTIPDVDANGEEVSETATRNLSLNGGLTLRYFPANNLSIGLQGYYFTDSNKTTISPKGGEETTSTFSDNGFLVSGLVNYHIRLSNSFFFRPGIGGGMIFGTREKPEDQNDPNNGRVIESDISGFAGKADLSFVFYAGDQWNLRAGADVLYRIGSVQDPAPEGGEKPDPSDFTRLDAGFSIGMGYSF